MKKAYWVLVLALAACEPPIIYFGQETGPEPDMALDMSADMELSDTLRGRPVDLGQKKDRGDLGPLPPDTGMEMTAPFDPAVFATTVQTSLDNRQCMGCHAPPNGAGGLTLTPNAMAGTPELAANIAATRARCNAGDPRASKLYDYATRSHAGGSLLFNDGQAAALLAWITGGSR